jgi:hypothetical protein
MERRSVYLDSIASLSPEELQPAAAGTSMPPVETEPQNFPAAGNTFSGEWKVVDGNTGEELYRFSGIGNSQSDANQVAGRWVRDNSIAVPTEIYPVMR